MPLSVGVGSYFAVDRPGQQNDGNAGGQGRYQEQHRQNRGVPERPRRHRPQQHAGIDGGRDPQRNGEPAQQPPQRITPLVGQPRRVGHEGIGVNQAEADECRQQPRADRHRRQVHDLVKVDPPEPVAGFERSQLEDQKAAADHHRQRRDEGAVAGRFHVHAPDVVAAAQEHRGADGQCPGADAGQEQVPNDGLAPEKFRVHG